MKKILLAGMVAAACSGAANAITYEVSSNITGVQWWLQNIELLTFEPGGHFSNIRFSGTATDVDGDGVIDSSQLSMSGELGFVANGLPLEETFALNDGHYVAGVGTTFTSGYIINDIWDGEGWQTYDSYDAYLENLGMVVGAPGHYIDSPGAGTHTTAGLLLAPGTTALPGLWDGIVGSGSYNNGITTFWFLGQNIGMFLQGTVTLTPVPVPAGIWLFGSGLLGLAGMSRKWRATR
jgi:hypothetical protein